MPTLLLVDDDEMIADLWTATFAAAGFSVLIAKNAKVGLEKAQTNLPDVILLDEMLPDMIGNEVLKTLKHDPRTQAIPVVCMSNYDNTRVMADAIQEGAVEYLFKDRLLLPEFVAKIKKLTSKVPDSG